MLKHCFRGWEAWIIGYRDEYFRNIGLAASEKIALLNGALECELRKYVIFEGDKKSFLAAGGKLKNKPAREEEGGAPRRFERDGRGGKSFRPDGKRRFDKDAPRRFDRKPADRSDATREAAPESENPLAMRRNPSALKSLVGRKPTLPPSEGPLMRSRGWKKK